MYRLNALHYTEAGVIYCISYVCTHSMCSAVMMTVLFYLPVTVDVDGRPVQLQLCDTAGQVGQPTINLSLSVFLSVHVPLLLTKPTWISGPVL